MENASLLKKIQALSFAKVETELYLDTHPNCKAALEYYRNVLDELDIAMTKYNNEVGPIFAEAASGDSWKWVEGKWPWQLDAPTYTEDK